MDIWQRKLREDSMAPLMAGVMIPMSNAMIAMVTSNSMSVKPPRTYRRRDGAPVGCDRIGDVADGNVFGLPNPGRSGPRSCDDTKASLNVHPAYRLIAGNQWHSSVSSSAKRDEQVR